MKTFFYSLFFAVAFLLLCALELLPEIVKNF